MGCRIDCQPFFAANSALDDRFDFRNCGFTISVISTRNLPGAYKLFTRLLTAVLENQHHTAEINSEDNHRDET
jgi:hypothetical protein